MKREKILFGVATTVTGRNMEETTSDEYVRRMIRCGAMYLWYYVYRPVGPDPSPELCVGREQMIALRRRLLALRRRHPIILIDTYWNAAGEAVCPAALGLGFHIGPQGSVEPCPPLSAACQTIRDNDHDLFRTIDESRFLRGFQDFVKSGRGAASFWSIRRRWPNIFAASRPWTTAAAIWPANWRPPRRGRAITCPAKKSPRTIGSIGC